MTHAKWEFTSTKANAKKKKLFISKNIADVP